MGLADRGGERAGHGSRLGQLAPCLVSCLMSSWPLRIRPIRCARPRLPVTAR